MNRESTFDISELFFSTTDRRGIIEFGNDVFVRVSGYESAELIGRPHNIVRHPDMPRLIFKMLWETIQHQDIIAAYVKNRAKDGSYYWVMAVVFPVGDKYLSVRLKPSTEYHAMVEDIYKKLLAAEKIGGVEASEKLLTEILKTAGFASYDAFSTKALNAEIISRDQLVKQDSAAANSASHTIRLMAKEALAASNYNKNTFDKISQLENSNSVFKTSTTSLLERFHDFKLLATNIQIFSAQFGENGKALAVIAQNFSSLVEEIKAYLGQFSQDSQKIETATLAFSKQMCGLKLLTDMVNFFVKETLDSSHEKSTTDKFAALSNISSTFTQLTAELTNTFIHTKNDTQNLIQRFSNLNLEMRKLVNGIELVSQVGNIEIARIPSQTDDLKHSISNMKKFSEVLRSNFQMISHTSDDLVSSLPQLDTNIRESHKCVERLFSLALKTS